MEQAKQRLLLLKTHKKKCIELLKNGVVSEYIELSGDEKEAEYYQQNKYNKESKPPYIEPKKWQKFKAYEAEQVKSVNKFSIILGVLLSAFILVVFYTIYSYYPYNFFVWACLFVVVCAIVGSLAKRSETLKASRKEGKIYKKKQEIYKQAHTEFLAKNYVENKDKINVSKQLYKKTIADFFEQQEQRERRNDPLLLEYIEENPHLIGSFLDPATTKTPEPPQYMKKTFIFLLKSWIQSVEILENYLQKIEKATGQDKSKSGFFVGKFVPDYTDEQKAILWQIDKTESFFKMLADTIKEENDPKILEQKKRQEDIKQSIIQHINNTAPKLDNIEEQDRKDFFLSDFNALIPFEARKRHTYIVGATGSGKSELIKLFLYNDIQHRSGALLIDPHNDVSLEITCLELFKKDPNRLVFLHVNPSEVIERFKLGLNNTYQLHYNPLEYRYNHIKNEQKKFDLIQGRAESLAEALEIAIQVNFTPQMENLVHFCLVVLLHNEGMKLNDLYKFLDDTQNSKYVELAMKINDPYIKEFFKEDGVFFSKAMNPTKDGMKNRLLKIVRSKISRIIDCEKSSFDIVKSLDEGKVVIIDLDKSHLTKKGMKALGALLVSEITTWAYSRDTEKVSSVFVYIDEAQNFITSTIVEALNEIRKFGVHFTLSHQNLSQFDTGDQSTKTKLVKGAVLGNTQVKLVGVVSEAADATNLTKATGGNIDIIKSQERLGTGNWLLNVRPYKAYFIKARSLLVSKGKKLGVLGTENYMSVEDYKIMFLQQLKKYYTSTKTGQSDTTQTPKKQTKRRPPNLNKQF